jgi:hypothetical protein
MTCDWQNKILEFTHLGQKIKIQGLLPPPLQATPISTNKLCNVTKGNDTWAFAIVSSTVPTSLSLPVDSTAVPAKVQQILD